MATATRVTVGVAATLIVDQAGKSASQEVRMKNIGASTVTVGGDTTVTTGNGFDIAAGAEEPFVLHRGDRLYGIVASGTCVVEVLSTFEE